MDLQLSELENAIERVSSTLSAWPSSALQEEFDAGLHPTLLAYDKVEPSLIDVPMIIRYLVGAKSHVKRWRGQVCNYYNIHAACRCVNMIAFIDTAFTRIAKKNVIGHDLRFERLAKEKRRDAFDAIAFEIITASAYAVHPLVTRVEFLHENAQKKTPDILVSIWGKQMSVECKKIDRTRDFMMADRHDARDVLNPILHGFRRRGQSVICDITFHTAPRDSRQESIWEACLASLSQGCPVLEKDFTASVRMLPQYRGGEPVLFPAPAFLWERYEYRVRSEWMGIVNQMECSKFRLSTLPPYLQGGESTWLNEVSWDAAAKYKISSKEIMDKYRRFGFRSVFEAFAQVKTAGELSAVHVWLESEYYSGSREEALRDLFNRISQSDRDSFGWLIVDEMLIDVSPKGRFDIVEHGHEIAGPLSGNLRPPVSTVFVPKTGIEGRGVFGKGLDLPDIDDLP